MDCLLTSARWVDCSAFQAAEFMTVDGTTHTFPQELSILLLSWPEAVMLHAVVPSGYASMFQLSIPSPLLLPPACCPLQQLPVSALRTLRRPAGVSAPVSLPYVNQFHAHPPTVGLAMLGLMCCSPLCHTPPLACLPCPHAGDVCMHRQPRLRHPPCSAGPVGGHPAQRLHPAGEAAHSYSTPAAKGEVLGVKVQAAPSRA